MASRLNFQERWVIPVSFASVILGLMLGFAWLTKEDYQSRLSFADPDQQQRLATGTLDQQVASQKLSSEIEKLRSDNTKLENTLASQTGSSKVLNDNLQEAKLFAGLTEVQGPGIVVTLRDSQKPQSNFVQLQIIHDLDVLRVVNELWNAGAEAIAVNGQRVSVTTCIRCVGSTILVNNQQQASPIKVSAIGDPSTLSGALNLPGGVLAELRETDPAMVQIDQVKLQTLPAFTGSTAFHIAEPVHQSK